MNKIRISDDRETLKIEESKKDILLTSKERTQAMNTERCLEFYDLLNFFNKEELIACAVLLDKIIEFDDNKNMSVKDLRYLISAYSHDNDKNNEYEEILDTYYKFERMIIEYKRNLKENYNQYYDNRYSYKRILRRLKTFSKFLCECMC